MMKGKDVLFLACAVFVGSVFVGAMGTGVTGVFTLPGDHVAASETRLLNGSACYNTVAGAICFQVCGSTYTDKGKSVTTGNSATWIPVHCYGAESCKQYIWVVGTTGCAGG